VYFFILNYNHLNQQSRNFMKAQATKIKKRNEIQYFESFARHIETVMHLLTLRKLRIAAGFAGVAVIALFALVVQRFSTESLSTHYISSQLVVPSEENLASPITIPLPIPTSWEPAILDPYADLEQQITKVRSGDSLSLIFDRVGFTPRQLYEVVSESEHGDELGRLYPGKELTFYSDNSGDLLHLEYRISALESYLVDKTESGYQSLHEKRTPESFSALKSGEIESSLYLAGLDAGLSDSLIMELAGIFGWDIDFALEIRRGDTFSVIYEDHYLDGEAIGQGNILAAEFTNQGRKHRAIRHTDGEGRSAYYTPEGESMRKAFLRTPVDVFWISSHFDPSRKHPVLNTIRAHNGTDYAAATGTPIRATGDGQVSSARYSSSYGNVVEVQHGQDYKTLYAHMNGFARGIRAGTNVQQGQIIGYVGMTGLATGPHLHFEFHVNGIVRNPVTVDLPNGAPLSAAQFSKFEQASAELIQLLDNPAVQYAEGFSLPENRS
jgi:murein DD-endopeptidase MepM/ murein hydrolase activator NlpD